ncbi:MAG: TnsA endonuclease N-terminal domain-containing protein [Blastocatellia bacterium]
MAKRNRNINERVIKRRLKEGRGQGRGADYQPWLHIQDVPSRGLATRIKGWKTSRCHHFLSKLECEYFYVLEWSPIVSDIREQYPLELAETQAIAERLGVAHPTDPRTRQPIVMTTDFVNTINQTGKLIDQARSIKYSQDLSSDRTLEKLEIERLYWSERKIDWGIVTEHEVEPILAANVSWVHPYRETTAFSPATVAIIRRVEAVLTPRVNEQRAPLRDLTDACDDQLGLSPGMSLSVARHLIANKRWQVDMKQAINTARPLQLLTVAPGADAPGRRKAGRK